MPVTSARCKLPPDSRESLRSSKTDQRSEILQLVLATRQRASLGARYTHQPGDKEQGNLRKSTSLNAVRSVSERNGTAGNGSADDRPERYCD
jgi:hypothetical protein